LTLPEKDTKIKDFFIGIKKLQNLRSLEIQLTDGHLKVSNAEFITLCRSLKNLTQLQTLKLSFPGSSTIEDKGIEKLSKIIPKFQGLQKFDLILERILKNSNATKKNLSKRSCKLLCEALTTLKYLSNLELSLDCQNISSKFIKSITSEISKMKSLNSLYLTWWSPDVDSDAFKDLKLIKKLFMFKTHLKIEDLC